MIDQMSSGLLNENVYNLETKNFLQNESKPHFHSHVHCVYKYCRLVCFASTSLIVQVPRCSDKVVKYNDCVQYFCVAM
jgi:hypothetical protein